MDLQNIKEVNVKIMLENGDGSSVACFEKAWKISEFLILSVYENGVEINEFHYNQVGDIVLGNEVLGLHGEINESAIDFETFRNMSALEFLVAISSLQWELY
ncbi:hypothetical protein [Bacillus cereus group sp. TH260-2LC]|uniref:hypothetical protein n=1 Tax=unclassified Bacillus cereus group TaxID=2750818 RepID=UPI0022E27B31|nr:hypothetical protein [Bacillus cereus group sp. TH260-2LC]MDA1528490.1 hypothetical protein [Bacillus cereus group sp. TH260-2LC]